MRKVGSWFCLLELGNWPLGFAWLLSLWLSDLNCASTLVSGLGTQPPRAPHAKGILGTSLPPSRVRQFLITNFIVNKYTAVLWRILTNT